MPVETDERLMQQMALGKRDALSALMRRHANSVLTYLRRMTGDEPLSEELFQDVFLAVWTHRRRYRSPLSFRAWLFGIAVNKCRAALRRRGEPAVSLELASIVCDSPRRERSTERFLPATTCGASSTTISPPAGWNIPTRQPRCSGHRFAARSRSR
jgi:DNA-directed RNA polymerase specialized sigma24 family protein